MRRLLRALRRALVWLLLAWITGVLLLAVGIILYGRADRAQAADVIVVLGAGLRADGRPGPALTRRAEHAAALWKDGTAPYIVCSGGYPLRLTRSEADACAEVLRDSGVPPSAIILEDRSRSTEENAAYTREVMDANGWQTAVVVSDNYHLLRATWLFNSAGIEHSTSPAADPPFANFLSAFGREIVAFHWQAFKGILNLPFTYVPVL